MDNCDLRDRRKKMGLTKAELAAEVGITERVLSFYESGEREIPRKLSHDLYDLLTDPVRCEEIKSK